MSIVAIRSALESALDGMTPALATAWENMPFTPITGTPYQRAYLMDAPPDNREFGASFQERGYFHLNLYYPQGNGTRDTGIRVDLIREYFKRGRSFGDVRIIATPTKKASFNDGDRFVTTVQIYFNVYVPV
jgi:hypothetical protein